MGRSKGVAQQHAKHTASDMGISTEGSLVPPTDDVPSFSKAEVERLRALMDSFSTPSGNCSLTMTGKNSNLLSLNALSTEDSWIIDSGATDHMTPYISHLSSYSTLLGKHHITVANGSQTPVIGYGNVQLSPFLHLKHVLHVPKLSNNLLSIQKLTKDLNCAVTFFQSHCVFQDLATGKTIGLAKEQDGLYYLPHKESKCHHAISESWANSQIWLQHRRLGHPPSRMLKSLFPHLFSTLSVESFHCDVCQFAKSQRATYSPSDSRSVQPFDLVHSDVWGPSSISNISGAKWFVTFIDDCTRVTWVFLMKDKSEVCQLFVTFFQNGQNT